MRGRYHANHGGRPRRLHRSGDDEAASARLYVCAECRVQALICSCCDRGQIYCAGDCGRRVRRRSQRAAGARYQASRRGRSRAARQTWVNGSGDRLRTALGAGGAVPTSSARDFDAAVAVSGDTEGQDAAMATPPDIEARILRYHHVEKWTIGTIAAQLHVHHSVVRRVLAQAGLPRIGLPPRKSKIDAYLPVIRQTLETFPTLTASHLYGMVRECGYSGSPDHCRHRLACHRPRPKAEAFLRLRALPGELAQVDWGHFEPLEIGRARRPLLGFVMVPSHSRQIYLRFFLDARMESFLRGHAAACAGAGELDRLRGRIS